MPGRRGEEKKATLSRGVFLLLAGFIVVLDQLTKALALSFLSPLVSHPVLPHVFHLTLVENKGVAFGLFQGFDRILFSVITLSLVLLTGVGLASKSLRPPTSVGIGLILGGALGNWIDRVRFGSVIDFLDFRIWPVFNFADIAITLGAGLFLLEFLRRRAS